jgi:hypothetical protein
MEKIAAEPVTCRPILNTRIEGRWMIEVLEMELRGIGRETNAWEHPKDGLELMCFFGGGRILNP